MKKKLSITVIFAIILTFVFGCEKTNEPDTTPPQVSISSPINNATVKDTVLIRSTVSDNDGISRVDFLVDGISIGSISNNPFEMHWDTKQISNGSHNLQCKAVDNSGNETLSEMVVVIVSNYLFKATFTNNWVSANEQCIIFISDNNGNILAEKTFNGNTSFEMFLNEGLNKRVTNDIKEINITTVVGNGNNSRITTNMKIPVGSSWTWKGYPSPDYENLNTVELNFQNMPDHEGYVLSSKWSSHMSSSGSLSMPYSFNFYETPMDIYLKLNTINSGIKYIWLKNIVSESRQDDLINMSNTGEKNIDMNGANGYRKFLYGFSNPGHRYEGRYRLDYGYDFDNSVNSVQVYYPDNSFTDYRTSLYFNDEIGNLYNIYYQSTYGSIPNNFTKINADFYFVSTSYNNFEISPSGEFMETSSSWGDENYNYWYLHGDKTTVKYKLPKLPNSVIQLFGLNRESFKLRYADLRDYTELNSYSEKLEIIFNSDNFLYDVINDFRARLKFYNDGGLSKQNVNELKFEEIYEKSSISQ